MTRLGAQALDDRGRPRTVLVVAGEVRGWLRALGELPARGGKRRVLARCLVCERDVAVSIDTWRAMRGRSLADAPEVCRHQAGTVRVEHPLGGGGAAVLPAQRVRGALEDLADAADAARGGVALLAVAAVLRARARHHREAPGGLSQARAADACARLLEYAAGAPEALRLVAREG